MKAISLWQPWASFMSLGLKRNETRGWPTNYRGLLAIHAAKFRVKEVSLEVAGRLMETEFYDASDVLLYDTLDRLPYGAILCVVELYDCVHTEHFQTTVPLQLSQQEADLGDYSPKRFAWLTRNLRRLKQPIQFKARQGLFEVPDELLKEVA